MSWRKQCKKVKKTLEGARFQKVLERENLEKVTKTFHNDRERGFHAVKLKQHKTATTRIQGELETRKMNSHHNPKILTVPNKSSGKVGITSSMLQQIIEELVLLLMSHKIGKTHGSF